MATVFWQAFFGNFYFLAFLISIFPSSLQFSHFCTILAFVYWFLLVSDQFWWFWGLLEKSRHPRWRTKIPTTQKWWRNSHVMWHHQPILWTSKEDSFQCTIYPLSLTVIVSWSSKGSGGGGGRICPPDSGTKKKKPRLKRVNTMYVHVTDTEAEALIFIFEHLGHVE